MSKHVFFVVETEDGGPEHMVSYALAFRFGSHHQERSWWRQQKCSLLFLSKHPERAAMQAASSYFCTAKPLAPKNSRVGVRAQGNSLGIGDRVAAEKSMAVKWSQKTVVIPPLKRGCHIVTPKLVKEIEEDLSGYKCGLAHFFLQHTSASLTINENYDPDVQHDMETFLNKTVPEGRNAPWTHTMEGADDMPAHVKSSMFGCSLTIPVTNGRLNMGTWQGIWLCEHRDHATARKVVITINGV